MLAYITYVIFPQSVTSK